MARFLLIVILFSTMFYLRSKLSINESAELVPDESGEKLFLVSRSRNQFLQHREMFLGFASIWETCSQDVS